MVKENQLQQAAGLQLPQTTAKGILGKQSVRATFKLSARAIDALSVVSLHLGIKKKSLFDYLMEDIRALNSIAREIEPRKVKKRDRIQKTYVLSRRSLSALEKVCKEFGAPRDALVERSILRLLPMISQEQEKHRKRLQFLERLDAHVQDGRTLLREAAALLGDDDPVTERLTASLQDYEHTRNELADFIERCRGIEEF